MPRGDYGGGSVPDFHRLPLALMATPGGEPATAGPKQIPARYASTSMGPLIWGRGSSTPRLVDVILSSGFLAFARHLGFLDALEVSRLRLGARPDTIVGTSSGALIGALYASGMSVPRMAELLSRSTPLRDVALRPRWRRLPRGEGPRRAASLLVVASGAERRLRKWLPATFEELPVALCVGVQNSLGGYELLTTGPLVEAVMASFAVPGLLAPVEVADQCYSDGGAVDRTGVEPWRRLRPGRRALLHEVARSRGARRRFSSRGIEVVRTPRARANFVSLRDFYRQMEEARAITLATLRANASL